VGYSLRDPGEPLPTGRGTTSVTVVVDQTGVVDPESLAVTATDQPGDVTDRAVAALAEWTFRPARAGTCWVPKRMRVDWVWGGRHIGEHLPIHPVAPGRPGTHVNPDPSVEIGG
jgi:hypothetical protein